jgi:hypothetical protein
LLFVVGSQVDDTGQLSYLAKVDGDRNDFCATLIGAVTLDRSLSAIITPISIIGAGIRVGRGRVM